MMMMRVCTAFDAADRSRNDSNCCQSTHSHVERSVVLLRTLRMMMMTMMLMMLPMVLMMM